MRGHRVRLQHLRRAQHRPLGLRQHVEAAADGSLVRVEPLVKTFGWYGGGWNFSPLGYRPGVAGARSSPPTPGLSGVMALTGAAFGEFGAYAAVAADRRRAGARLLPLGRRLHSRTAGLVAAALVATSPVLLFYVVQPMSDVPAAAWVVFALAAALGDAGGRPSRPDRAWAWRRPRGPTWRRWRGRGGVRGGLAAPFVAAAARDARGACWGSGLVPVLGPADAAEPSLYGSASVDRLRRTGSVLRLRPTSCPTSATISGAS